MEKRTPPGGLTQAAASLIVIPLCLLPLVLAACSAPAVEGYQLQGTPEGFLYAQLRERSPGALDGRQVEAQGMWVGDIRLDEPHTTILVTTYAGGTPRGKAEEVRDARAARLARNPGMMVGPVRDVPLELGGVAWAWTEEWHDEYGRFRSLTVSAVASFDSVTFALEFDTDVPERMTQAHADSVLATFGAGRTVVHWNVVLAVLGMVGFVALGLFRRTRPRHATAYRLWEKAPAPKSPPHPPGGTAPHPPDAP